MDIVLATFSIQIVLLKQYHQKIYINELLQWIDIRSQLLLQSRVLPTSLRILCQDVFIESNIRCIFEFFHFTTQQINKSFNGFFSISLASWRVWFKYNAQNRHIFRILLNTLLNDCLVLFPIPLEVPNISLMSPFSLMEPCLLLRNILNNFQTTLIHFVGLYHFSSAFHFLFTKKLMWRFLQKIPYRLLHALFWPACCPYRISLYLKYSLLDVIYVSLKRVWISFTFACILPPKISNFFAANKTMPVYQQHVVY